MNQEEDMLEERRLEPSFEYFMSKAMTLETDIERYKFEIIKLFLEGKNIESIMKEYGYSREVCTRFLVETAGNLNRERKSYYRLDVRYIRHDRNGLLEKLSTIS